MPDRQKRNTAKQARRDARRKKAHSRRELDQVEPEEAGLVDEVGRALDGDQPLDLLGLVSTLIVATTSGTGAFQRPGEEAPPSLAELVPAFIDEQTPETSALLTALGELLPGDNPLRSRCRAEAQDR